MKKSHVAYTAIFLIVLIMLFLSLRIWSAARAVAVVGPTAIHRGPNGIIYIMSNDVVYLHDSDGGLIDRVPMSRFGTNHVIGDFSVYKNGDLLLRREVPQTLTITGEAEFFARTGAGENDRLGTGESILQQCSFETYHCRNFGGGGDVFDKITAFSLLVDEEKRVTYLSDTVGHQLLQLDDTGKIIARSTAPFLFPNQIVLHNDGLLYVADTNNHRIAAVKTENDRFGAVVKEFKIVDPRNALISTWPMALAPASDGKWWVINAGDNMIYGMVMILNETGKFEKIVPLPEGADPLRLLVVDNRVLITDPSLMRVYSVDRNGELGEDFGSETFKMDLSALFRERRTYELMASMAMWSLLVLLAGALFLARAARLQEATEITRKAETRPTAGTELRREGGAERYDYHSMIGMHRIKFALITVVLLVIMSFFFMISRGLTVFHKGLFPTTLLGHFLISFFTYLHLKRSYVEIDDRGITYRGMSRNIQSPWNAIRKISVYGTTSKVVTDHGNFSIGPVEPANGPPLGWLDMLRRNRAKLHKQLIEKIQQRAPQAKVSISWLVRYQWKRL